MEKKTWTSPQLYLIAINTKTISGPLEHNYTSKATASGHKLYHNTPNHNSFASKIVPTIHQYLS